MSTWETSFFITLALLSTENPPTPSETLLFAGWFDAVWESWIRWWQHRRLRSRVRTRMMAETSCWEISQTQGPGTEPAARKSRQTDYRRLSLQTKNIEILFNLQIFSNPAQDECDELDGYLCVGRHCIRNWCCVCDVVFLLGIRKDCCLTFTILVVSCSTGVITRLV